MSPLHKDHPIIIIGAGIGGLTTAAVLARRGFPVQVLEAHVYPGGCAGTFYHQGYRFDAGATLAGGFYPGGPMDIVARAAGFDDWAVTPESLAMVVHLPTGQAVPRWGDTRRHQTRLDHFGAGGERFFAWQEKTADAMWALALRVPPWLPQSARDALILLQQTLPWAVDRRVRGPLMRTLPFDAFRSVAAHLRHADDNLRRFVDAQLLISAQTTSVTANALYGASALDLPRRGVVHLQGGMGAIGERLAQAVRDNGGEVHYRQEVQAIRTVGGRVTGVETKRGGYWPASAVVANLPPWNVAQLLGSTVPARLQQLSPDPQPGWGAFMAYVGVDDAVLPPDFPLHHQVIAAEPMGEGNTIFLSFSPPWDDTRAPTGQRALTISTHTKLSRWWRLFSTDRQAYEAEKGVYVEKLLRQAKRVVPGLDGAVRFVKPGTPVTFQRFTRRHRGWVGGFPQTSLFTAWQPGLMPGLWLVGDSIFPGQSVAAVALGGLRVAAQVATRPLL